MKNSRLLVSLSLKNLGFLVTLGNILINYFGLKLFVEVFQWWPTVSYIIISVICVTFSYLTNKFYSFRKEKKEKE